MYIYLAVSRSKDFLPLSHAVSADELNRYDQIRTHELRQLFEERFASVLRIEVWRGAREGGDVSLEVRSATLRFLEREPDHFQVVDDEPILFDGFDDLSDARVGVWLDNRECSGGKYIHVQTQVGHMLSPYLLRPFCFEGLSCEVIRVVD